LFLPALRHMLQARILDDKLAALYRTGKIFGGVFLGRGQEALSVAIGIHLRRGDVFAPLIRDQAGRLAFGEPVVEAVQTALGSVRGPMRGRDGNVHRGRPKEGLLPMISHLGAMIAVANGVLFARRWRGEQSFVGAVSVGDGATSTGSFHEGLNQAAVERLPLVMVIANNQYAYSTPTSRQYACKRLIDKAIGYGVEGHEVDGTDLAVLEQQLHQQVLCGHGEHDDASYVNAKLREAPVGRDCLRLAEARALDEGWLLETDLRLWREQAIATVDAAVTQVQREPAPDPFQEDWVALASRHLAEGWEQSA